MACKAAFILYLLVQLPAFVFVLVGTPIDMFRAKEDDLLGNTPCMTLWGHKAKCYDTKYAYKLDVEFAACDGRKTRFKVAEAFALVSILIYGVALVFAFIQLCCCQCLRWVCLVLNIFGIATACLVWANMTYAFYNQEGGCLEYKEHYKYGAGFALFVVGWCLDILGIIFLLLPC